MFFAILLAAAAPTPVAPGAATPTNAVATPAAPQEWVRMADTARYEMRSASGRDYSIFVATPLEQAPPNGWPVVYVLDGNSLFPMVGRQAQRQGRRPDKGGGLPAIVVAIGYPGDAGFQPERSHDFTPKAPEREPRPAPGGDSWREPGGAEAFFDFIEHQVKPRIESEYKVDKNRQALFGHSLGGLFVLNAWITHPDAYSTFMAASPSVWWNKDYILDQAKLRAGAASPANSGALMIAVGEKELPDMVAGATSVSEVLKPLNGSGQNISFHPIPFEEHVSVVPVAFNRLLWQALEPTASDLTFYRDLYDPAKLSTAPAPPVPTKDRYLAMSAKERFDLRMKVRGLTVAERKKFDAGLYEVIRSLSPQQAATLRAERDQWGRRNGIVPFD